METFHNFVNEALGRKTQAPKNLFRKCTIGITREGATPTLLIAFGLLDAGDLVERLERLESGIRLEDMTLEDGEGGLKLLKCVIIDPGAKESTTTKTNVSIWFAPQSFLIAKRESSCAQRRSKTKESYSEWVLDGAVHKINSSK